MNARKIVATLAVLATVSACGSHSSDAGPSLTGSARPGGESANASAASTAVGDAPPSLETGGDAPTVIIDGQQRTFDTSNVGGGCVHQPVAEIVWISGDITKGTGVGNDVTQISAGMDPVAGLLISLQFDQTEYRVDPVTRPQSGSYTVSGPENGWYTFTGTIAELLKDANGTTIGGSSGPLHHFTVRMKCNA